MQTFLTVLVAAPVVFLALFLFQSPVSKLVFPEQAKATTVAVGSKTPVVLIVFDEFPTIALMNRAQHVDAARFPNFASLARNATWYRSATTVHPHTEHAVPAILTGKLPKQSELPIFADHRQNLFTFLGGSYRLERRRGADAPLPGEALQAARGGRLSSSTRPRATRRARSPRTPGIVYLHLLLPEPYVAHVPPISNTWGNFGGSEQTEPGEQPYCGRNICKLASLITADRKPTLYMVHSLLPHVPWLYLPVGQALRRRRARDPRRAERLLGSDTWLAEQAEQRFFLQLGYADSALGLLLHRLRATGVYDRALVIVTADHGVSFRPDTPRRNISGRNLADIAFMPLFVKLPGQKRGRIDDSFVADDRRAADDRRRAAHEAPVAGGRQAADRTKLPRDGTVRIATSSGGAVTSDLRALLARRRRALADQIATFGTGALARVYRIGPHRELLEPQRLVPQHPPELERERARQRPRATERRRPRARSRPHLRDGDARRLASRAAGPRDRRQRDDRCGHAQLLRRGPDEVRRDDPRAVAPPGRERAERLRGRTATR